MDAMEMVALQAEVRAFRSAVVIISTAFSKLEEKERSKVLSDLEQLEFRIEQAQKKLAEYAGLERKPL